jgi:hypothetical protein
MKLTPNAKWKVFIVKSGGQPSLNPAALFHWPFSIQNYCIIIVRLFMTSTKSHEVQIPGNFQTLRGKHYENLHHWHQRVPQHKPGALPA